MAIFPLTNHRRRKDILVLMTMVGTASPIGDDTRFKTLGTVSVFSNFIKLVKAHEFAVPDKWERAKEQNNSKMVVNTVLSPIFGDFRHEVQLWMAATLVKGLVAGGWKPDNSQEVMDFVQSLYGLSQSFPKFDAPPAKVVEIASMSPELFKAAGFFR